MALSRATDRRITRHLAYRIQILSQHQRATAQPRCSQSGLDPRVAAANNQDVDRVSECEHFQESRASDPEEGGKDSRSSGLPASSR